MAWPAQGLLIHELVPISYLVPAFHGKVCAEAIPVPQRLLIIFKDSLGVNDSAQLRNLILSKGETILKPDYHMLNKTAPFNIPIRSKRAATTEQLSSHWKILKKQTTQIQFKMYWFHVNQHQSVDWNNYVQLKMSHLTTAKMLPLTFIFGHLVPYLLH